MRLLSERRHPDREGVSRPASEGHRRRDPAGDVGRALPLLHPHAHAARHQALPAGGVTMTSRAVDALARGGFSRRDFLQRPGMLLVSFSARGSAPALGAGPVRYARLARRSQPARFVDCDRGRRHGHGLHRQVRARPGDAHGPDAARRRGAVGAARSRPADHVRHRRVRPTRGRPREASPRRPTSTIATSPWPAATARETLLRLASARLGVPVDQLSARGRRHQRRPGPIEARDVRRARVRQDARTCRSTRRRRGNRRRPGRCSGRRCRESTWRRWRPAGSSTCTTSACRACSTA